MLNMVTAQENHDRFLRRTVEHEAAWTVWGNTGPAIAESDDDSRDVYLVFSDQAYAKRALRETWPDCPKYSTREISLFDLLFRWLPGMSRDGHLCGTNWTGDLIGLEVEPDDLQVQLYARIPEALKARFREILARR
jgi:hypothetical protein